MTADLRTTPWYQSYERARAAVLRMKHATAPAGGAIADPSAYWTDELENIDYLIEATPLVVRKLRHHAFHITGIRPYDYRTKDDARRQHFEERLRALRELGGPSLLVPESPALGGFGYTADGALLNVDTLKFYEVLVGMERGSVLQTIRTADRPVVCEIGAGWAGFAYQFKTLFPRTTYVIVDFPELFLFSATYLGAVFPDARLHFVESDGPDALEGWRDADVVFVPNTLAHVVSSLPLDLTINMVSFQEMTDAQVRGYADMAARADCPLLYSLNRERSPYNTELVSVSEALSERYRLTEVPVLDTDYTSAMKRPVKSGRLLERSPLSYRHLVGRLDRPAGQITGARGRGAAVRADGAPTVVLGMTLYNNARHLREAMDSLLAQTFESFQLILLDDASEDETEAIAREYAARDPRVRYFRHATRAAMIATWREVAEIAGRECPGAEYFAWVSDHDRWHPRWLERLVAELETDRDAVLAYPITRRLSAAGDELDKGPRLFDTAHAADLPARWKAFCHKGAGSGDSVYGLVRFDALRRAGIFRQVLRPDRLLMAELTLYGRFRQVPEVLWYRRQAGASVDRQRQTLLLEGEQPSWFAAPPSFQHAHVLWREYVRTTPRPLPISPVRWAGMLARYQLTYGWRHFRKSGASRAVRRGIDLTILGLKTVRRLYHHAVYWTLVNGRLFWGRTRRAGRRSLYHVLVLTHRTGLRGRGQTPRPVDQPPP